MLLIQVIYFFIYDEISIKIPVVLGSNVMVYLAYPGSLVFSLLANAAHNEDDRKIKNEYSSQ